MATNTSDNHRNQFNKADGTILGGITVRPIIKNLTLLTATAVASISQAAPMSMLQSIERENMTKAAQPAEVPGTSKMGWLTKWMGNKPSDVVSTNLDAPNTAQVGPRVKPVASLSQQSFPNASQIAASHNPQMAYVPPEVPSLPPTNIVASSVSTSATEQTHTPLQAANARSLREQGHDADRRGLLGEAERCYRLAIEADPTSAASVNDLALCLARQGQFDSSAANFMQAIAMRPEKPLYRNNIATVLVEMGRYDDAKSHLMAAYPPATASYNLGHLLTKRGKSQEAILAFQEAIAFDPNFSSAHEMLAKLQPTNMTPPTMALTQVKPTKGNLTTSPAPYLAQASNVTRSTVTNEVPMVQNGTNTLPSSATPNFPRLLPPVINR